MQTRLSQVALGVLFLHLVGLVGTAQSVPDQKRVLLIHHYGRESPGVVLFDQGFESTLKSNPSNSIELYRETLEQYRFGTEAHTQLMRQYLKTKYAERRVDVVVAYTDTVLDFLRRYRDELFPNVPIVYVVTKLPEPGDKLQLSTGLWTGPSMSGTLELALHLQPSTTDVFVVVGPVSEHRMVELETRKQLKDFESRVKLTYLVDRSLEEVVERVKNLPEHSIVLCEPMNRSGAGKGVVPGEAVSMVARAANVPVYVSNDVFIGAGAVGGRVTSHEGIGNRVAQMTLKIIQGASPDEIPVETATIVPIFDWRQLKRWGISESDLPAHSIVRFKQETFWEQYRARIAAVLTALLVQTLLITGLLVQRARRARAEASRRNSERDLQRLTAELIRVQDDERRRVAAELHDGLGQTLSIINNRTTICMNNLNDETCLKEQLGEISEVAFAGLDEVREIAHNLRPYELDRLGLVQAIESMVEKVSNSTSIKISSEVDEIDGQLSRDAETSVYRILQEGLNNVLKHASASAARVSIKQHSDSLLITLSDNGKGFDKVTSRGGEGKGFGLAGITERARMLGATCMIDSRLGQGTVLTLRIPRMNT